MTTAVQNSKKIIDFLYNFSDIVKKEKWISRYDKDTDALSFTIPNLSDSSRIFYLDDEIAFYFNKDKKIEGIFIEYFTSNFVQHHQEIKGVIKDIKKEEKKENSLIKINFMKDKKILPKFEEIIKDSLLENYKLQEVK